MVLYEDLRIYTIWRTDVAECKQQALDYKKSAEEWEILGDLAERLHHPAEAVEAFQACLRIRFSPKAMNGVLKKLESEGQYKEELGALIRLIAWQYRWYSEVNPSPLLCCLPLCNQTKADNSFHPISCTPSANSSRKKARSRSAVSCRPQACHNRCWI